MDSQVKVIIAYAIIAIGPIVGSYMVVKNSSKLTGALMGGMTKLAQRASKALSGVTGRYDKMRRNENRTKALRYDGGGSKLLQPFRKANKKFAQFTTGYGARQGASEESLKDARRKYIISRAGDEKFMNRMAGPGATEQERAMLAGRYQEEEDKMHTQAVNFARQAVSKEYNASGDEGRVKIAEAAHKAVMSRNQVQLDALMSHAAAAGADEFSDVYERLQQKLGGPSTLTPSISGNTGSPGDLLSNSNRFVYATQGAELGQKSRGVATMIQQGNGSLTVEDALTENGIRVYYQKMSADKVANFSSNTAKAAAEFLDTAILKQLIYDPNTSKNVGTTAMQAYRKELAARIAGVATQTQAASRDPNTGKPTGPIPPKRQPLTQQQVSALPPLPQDVGSVPI